MAASDEQLPTVPDDNTAIITNDNAHWLDDLDDEDEFIASLAKQDIANLPEHYNETYREACRFCRHTFLNEETLGKHITLYHPNGKLLTCPDDTCGKTFSNISIMYRHFYELHCNVDRSKCPFCTQTFKRNESLRDHVRRQHPEYDVDLVAPVRPKKGRKKKSKAAIGKDPPYPAAHVSKTFPCTEPRCGLSFVNKFVAQDHVAREHGPDATIKCLFCGVKYHGKITISYHYHVKHYEYWASKDTACPECGRTVTKRCLKKHISRFHSK